MCTSARVQENRRRARSHPITVWGCPKRERRIEREYSRDEKRATENIGRARNTTFFSDKGKEKTGRGVSINICR